MSGYGLSNPRFDFQQEQRLISLPLPALRSTQWVPVDFFFSSGDRNVKLTAHFHLLPSSWRCLDAGLGTTLYLVHVSNEFSGNRTRSLNTANTKDRSCFIHEQVHSVHLHASQHISLRSILM